MAFIKFNQPLPPAFSHTLNDFFGKDISKAIGSDHAMSIVKVNVLETEKKFKLEVAAPGLKKESFELNLDKNLLHIQVTQKDGEKKNEERYTRREFNYNSFKRSFQLPKLVDTNAIHARYENGILYISIPKKAEAVQAKRQIEIA